jgi:hypothetical protein
MIEKLIRIQSELKAPKGQTNAFGKYKYRSCEDIIEAVKPLLARERLLMTISDEIVEVGGRVYVKATVNLCDGATVMFTTTASPVCMSLQPVAPKGAVSVTAYAREEETKKGMDAAQITGAASSYARKYALNGMFAIDDTKDADSTNTHGKKEEEAPDEPDEDDINFD